MCSFFCISINQCFQSVCISPHYASHKAGYDNGGKTWNNHDFMFHNDKWSIFKERENEWRRSCKQRKKNENMQHSRLWRFKSINRIVFIISNIENNILGNRHIIEVFAQLCQVWICHFSAHFPHFFIFHCFLFQWSLTLFHRLLCVWFYTLPTFMLSLKRKA